MIIWKKAQRLRGHILPPSVRETETGTQAFPMSFPCGKHHAPAVEGVFCLCKNSPSRLSATAPSPRGLKQLCACIRLYSPILCCRDAILTNGSPSSGGYAATFPRRGRRTLSPPHRRGDHRSPACAFVWRATDGRPYKWQIMRSAHENTKRPENGDRYV